MQTTFQNSFAPAIKLSLLLAMALLTQQSKAQVVPYRVDGTGTGNLLDLTATGDAIGLHFGRLSYVVDQTGLDIQTASDGSELWLQRINILLIETSDPDPVTGFVVTTAIDEWQILGGTKRFRNAAAVPDHNIISTTVTAPYDPNGDLTALPFSFQKVGKINLGRRR